MGRSCACQHLSWSAVSGPLIAFFVLAIFFVGLILLFFLGWMGYQGTDEDVRGLCVGNSSDRLVRVVKLCM